MLQWNPQALLARNPFYIPNEMARTLWPVTERGVRGGMNRRPAAERKRRLDEIRAKRAAKRPPPKRTVKKPVTVITTPQEASVELQKIPTSKKVEYRIFYRKAPEPEIPSAPEEHLVEAKPPTPVTKPAKLAKTVRSAHTQYDSGDIDGNGDVPGANIDTSAKIRDEFLSNKRGTLEDEEISKTALFVKKTFVHKKRRFYEIVIKNPFKRRVIVTDEDLLAELWLEAAFKPRSPLLQLRLLEKAKKFMSTFDRQLLTRMENTELIVNAVFAAMIPPHWERNGIKMLQTSKVSAQIQLYNDIVEAGPAKCGKFSSPKRAMLEE